MTTRSLILFLLMFSHTAFSAVTVSETGVALTDCGGGVWTSGLCPYVAVGNCDGAQGTAVAIDFSVTLPENTGRFLSMAASSTGTTFNAHTGADAIINWSSRYRDSYVGVPPNKNRVGIKSIDEYVIETLPSNGTLWEGSTQIVSADHTILDPDSVWYKPNTSYAGVDSVTYCAIDSTGRSNIATININVADPASYPMPLGFPAISFGINESPPADPVEWPAAENANNYYIDSDDPGCLDTTNGYPNQPRCSWPDSGTIVTAGSKIVLADSVNGYPLRSGISWHSLDLDGTVGNPVWIVGNVTDAIKPRIEHSSDRLYNDLRLFGSYIRIEGVTLDSVGFRHMDGVDSNIVVRNSIIENYNRTVGTVFDIQRDQVLALNNTFRNNGSIELDLNDENDVHGFAIVDASNFYVLDHNSYAHAGDSFQIGNTAGSEFIYVGRMISHSDMENCVDIKTFDKALITESDCYDLREVNYTSGSNGFGQGFYVNDEGPQSNWAYLINNRCWDVSGSCFGTQNIAGGKTYFINNIALWAPPAMCIDSGGGVGERHFLLNTCANVNRGINVYTANLSTERYYNANLITNVTDSHLRFTAFEELITLADYNAIVENPGIYKYGTNSPPEDTTTAANFAEFKTATGTCANCAENVSVTFANSAIYDFSITAGSLTVPASLFGTGVGQDDALFDLNADLGITIQDLNGSTRPVNVSYEAGAYEAP